MDLGGFHQVIFICHSPLVWGLADRILSVNGGSVVADGFEHIRGDK
jgi:DNA repair ATPase RecN